MLTNIEWLCIEHSWMQWVRCYRTGTEWDETTVQITRGAWQEKPALACEHQCGVVSLLWLDGAMEMMGWPIPLWTWVWSHHHHCHLSHSLELDSSLSSLLPAGCHGLAELSMLMPGICAHHEIVKAVGANEDQMVVYSPQMVYHHPFILAFFPTPQAEG